MFYNLTPSMFLCLQLMEFFKGYSSTALGYRQAHMGMEQIRANIMWLSEHEEEVAAWFERVF